MRLSRKWLDRFVNTEGLSIQEMAEKITSTGFEVEGIETMGEGTNLVIGEVLTCEPHPDSDHLHITTVNVGDEVLNIVCGAPNVAAGQKVIVAKPGAVLPGGEIKAGKIRGQESNGMICALFELGVDKHLLRPDQVAGIEILPEDAPVGHTDPLDWLGWKDEILDIGLTPNRSDCQAVFNMAKEAGAALNREVKFPAFEGEANCGGPTEWKIESETEGCPLFLGKAIKSVTIKESPKWMKEVLRAAGVHSINNVVDISNIVMLETGNPMHFYDINAIPAKEITVKEGFEEGYTALDGVTYQLQPEDLVITTEGKPIGIAGIMGGDDSKILDTTTGLFLECAIFDHVRIRNTARRLNLNTEASQRYAKGLEPSSAFNAMDRAVQLLKEYADAEGIEETVIFGNPDMEKRTITVTLSAINNRLGTKFNLDEVVDVLARLDFEPQVDGETITLTVPLHRTDMEGLADVSEEVIRMLGYDRLESSLPLMEMTEGKLDARQKLNRLVGTLLTGQGLQEAVTYTLVSTDKKDDAILSAGEAVELCPPLSEERRWVRTSILPSLLERAAFNKARRAGDVALFETSSLDTNGKVVDHVAFVLEGNLQNTDWNGYSLKADFYTAKGLVEMILERAGVNPAMVKFEANKDDAHFHPYRSAKIVAGKKTIGYVGQIHPDYAEKTETGEAVMAELDLTALLNLKKSKVRYTPLSKFPAVQRDLAVVMDKAEPVQKVLDVIAQSGRLGKETVIRSVDVVDVYEGEHIAGDKKSVTIRILFQSDAKTLTEAEIAQMMEKILEQVKKRTSADLR